MKKVLVEFMIHDDCEPSVVDEFIITKSYAIVMSINGLATDYALELIEKAEFPIDIIRDVFHGDIEESEVSAALHPEAWDMPVIEALKKNRFWDKLTSESFGHYYFVL